MIKLNGQKAFFLIYTRRFTLLIDERHFFQKSFWFRNMVRRKGTKVGYSQEQTKRYFDQSARYSKAQRLRPEEELISTSEPFYQGCDRIITKTIKHKYASKRSPNSFWELEVTQDNIAQAEICYLKNTNPVCNGRNGWTALIEREPPTFDVNFETEGGEEGFISENYTISSEIVVYVLFNAFTIKDRLIIRTANGIISDSGCISGFFSPSISLISSDFFISFQVIANCAGESGTTRWELSVSDSPGYAPTILNLNDQNRQSEWSWPGSDFLTNGTDSVDLPFPSKISNISFIFCSCSLNEIDTGLNCIPENSTFGEEQKEYSIYECDCPDNTGRADDRSWDFTGAQPNCKHQIASHLYVGKDLPPPLV